MKVKMKLKMRKMKNASELEPSGGILSDHHHSFCGDHHFIQRACDGMTRGSCRNKETVPHVLLEHHHIFGGSQFPSRGAYIEVSSRISLEYKP